MRLSNRVLAVALALALLAGVSCSCGGGPPATPTPAVTPTPTAMPTPTPPVTSTPAGTPMPDYVEYTDEENGFAILHTQGWEEYSTAGTLVAFGAGEADVLCAPQFSVAREELSEPATVDAWFDELKGNFTAVEGYTSISEEHVTVSGVAAIEHVCSFDVQEVSFTAMLLYAVEDSTGWTVFSTCRWDCWEDYEAVFETVLYSLHFLD